MADTPSIRQQIRERHGDTPNGPDPMNILNITGFVQTVTTIPTKRPRSFNDQVKIYIDNIAAPTVRRLYIYSIEADDWLYVNLST